MHCSTCPVTRQASSSAVCEAPPGPTLSQRPPFSPALVLTRLTQICEVSVIAHSVREDATSTRAALRARSTGARGASLCSNTSDHPRLESIAPHQSCRHGNGSCSCPPHCTQCTSALVPTPLHPVPLRSGAHPIAPSAPPLSWHVAPARPVVSTQGPPCSTGSPRVMYSLRRIVGPPNHAHTASFDRWQDAGLSPGTWSACPGRRSLRTAARAASRAPAR
jgi:hypothetical protein